MNIEDCKGHTPLHVCTRRGFINISKLLIQSECNINLPNIYGESPLDVANSKSNETIVKTLRENDARGTKYQRDPLLHKPAGVRVLAHWIELEKVSRDPLLHKLAGPSRLVEVEKEELGKVSRDPLLYKLAGPSRLGELEKEELGTVSRDPLLYKPAGPSRLGEVEKEKKERITSGTETQN